MLQQITPNKNGELFQSDYAQLTGGTNLADSVFMIKDTQAAGGYNFDYVLTGGIRKRLAPTLINTNADSQLRTLGFGLYYPASGSSKSLIRAAGTKLQYFDTTVTSLTALVDDTASAGSTPFASGSTQTVQFSQFNNGVSNILWASGGGATLPVGAYSTTNYTTNGCAAPTGSCTATNNTSGSGSWSTGNYGKFYYALVLRKRSTQALSNAALDCTATTTNTLTDTVTLSWSISNIDTTLYDQIWIFRSAVGGVSAFTTGNLIAQVASTATSFTDKGDIGNPDILSAQNVPRAGNVILDNSTLPPGTYNTSTVFKRRFVACSGSTVYLSEVNKSESWPLTNVITIPSAGPITAVAVMSFTSPQAQSLDEILVIFKERELWVITGSAYQSDSSGNVGWALKFIDQVGCADQSLVVFANGFLSWIDFRGIYLWDGTSKPIYCSRLIEPLFTFDGDLDKTKLSYGCGEFFRRENQIIWYLSSKTYGEQQLAIKMDLRLTLPMIEQNMTGRNIDAVLVQDAYAFPIYSAFSYIPSDGSQEQMVLGDKSGFCYYASNGYADGTSDYSFKYLTKPLSMGDPNTEKLFHSVIVWASDVGNWPLYLDYWTNYQVGPTNQLTKNLPITTEAQSATALWDIAYWDVAYWDSYAPNVVPLIFNLGAQGSSLQLQFRNETQNQPITIHGFSVLWSAMGGISD